MTKGGKLYYVRIRLVDLIILVKKEMQNEKGQLHKKVTRGTRENCLLIKLLRKSREYRSEPF